MIKPTKDEIHYLLLKLHSLTGIVPIGAFLVIHLSINSLRTVGVLPYQLSIDVLNNLPYGNHCWCQNVGRQTSF